MVRKFGAALIALSLGIAAFALRSGVLGGGTADYAPENIERTAQGLHWVCLLPPICPVSTQTREVIRRAISEVPAAEDLLGLTLLTGDGLPRDDTAGLAWIARAAEHGDPDAARDISDRLRNGAAIEVDETKIVAALTPRVDAGDVEAMRALGPMIIRGRGAEQNTAKGLGLLKRAAATGSSAGERDLAQLYLLGAPGVAPDRNEALKWLGASARHGDVDAMVSLGYLSMNTPIGVSSKERNLAESYCWLMRAALLDDPQAQEKGSMTLASGDADDMGTTIGADLVQADFFFRLAARSPYHDNSQIRGSIEPKMTTAQLQDAKRLLESWQPRAWVDVKAMTIPLPAFSKAAPPRSCPAVG